MKNLRRRYIPNFSTLNSSYDFDVAKLCESYTFSLSKNDTEGMNHRIKINDVENKDNPKFYGTDETGYEQVNLTSYDDLDSSGGYVEATWQWWNSRKERTLAERKSFYRKSLQNKLKGLESTIETSYAKMNALSDSYMKDILHKFKGNVTRVRWAVAAPGLEMQPHLDYDTTYAVRYHLPVITNKDAIICVERNGVVQKINMAASGQVYFINQGFTHWIENNGTKPRVHLIVTVVGQEDMESSNGILI
mgnify:CR=1 FL=1